MKKLDYKTAGEFTNELITLQYDSEVIYEGYTDDLITSVTGDLEMNLNFGMNHSYSVVARRFGNFIVWIPKLPLAPHYRYEKIIFTLQQFKELWTFLKYEANDDLEIIKNISEVELKLVWMTLARGKEQINDIPSLMKSVEKNTIALSTNLEHQKTTFYNLIKHEWEFDFNKSEIIEDHDNWERFIAYLDDGINDEWEVFKRDNKSNFYIYLGNGFCLPIEIPRGA